MKLKKTKAKKTTMLPGKGKTWIDKLNDDSKEAQVKRLEKDFADMPANSMMLIASPKIIDNYIQAIPKGKSVSLSTLRKDLAAEYHADYTCPVTIGIFLRIVAEAAYQQYEEGRSLQGTTPFWRVINEKSPMLKKLSFGRDFVLSQRRKEGLISDLPEKE